MSEPTTLELLPEERAHLLLALWYFYTLVQYPASAPLIGKEEIDDAEIETMVAFNRTLALVEKLGGDPRLRGFGELSPD
jgi:hypothetical protein